MKSYIKIEKEKNPVVNSIINQLFNQGWKLTSSIPNKIDVTTYSDTCHKYIVASIDYNFTKGNESFKLEIPTLKEYDE